MKPNRTDEQPRHPIGVVSIRTGLPQETLRAWERRYQAITPGRSPKGRRLYSDLDVQRLRLLRRLVSNGRRISSVATLSLEELEDLAAEDAREADSASAMVPQKERNDPKIQLLLNELIDALIKLDTSRFDHLLSEAALTVSKARLRSQLLVPLLRTIGDQWQDGRLRVVHEHLAIALLRSFVESLRNKRQSPTAPKVVVTTPAGQYHEFGALLAAASADDVGWQVVYFGANLPADEIAAGTQMLNAQVVALSVVYSENNLKLLEELKKLRTYLDKQIVIIVGGHAAKSLQSQLKKLGILYIEDFLSFQETLGDLTI